MELLRNLLDKRVVDRRQATVGRVDGAVLSLAEGRAPRVVAIQIGGSVMARRVSPRVARWLERLVRSWGIPLGRSRIPWSRVSHIDREVHVDVDAERTRARALERCLRARVIGRIPGAG